MDFLSNCNANHGIINGDFNISSIDWSIQTSEPLHQCLLDKKDNLSLPQTVHFKTTNANILDLVLVSNQVEIIDTLTLDVFTAPSSDHKPINSIIRIRELKKSSTFSKTSFYSYCKADFNGLNDAFSINNFSPYCWSNVSKIVELWYERIHSFLPKFNPRRTQHRQNLPRWITPETSNSMKRLSTLRKQKGSQFALVIAMNEKVQTAVENNKSEYEQHLSNTRDTEALFNYYRKFRNSEIPSVMKLDNSVAKTLPEHANLFAKFFKLAFIISSQPSCLEKQEHSLKQIIHNIEPDRNLITKLCDDRDLSKSRGPDLLPPVLYKRYSESLTPSLYHIIYKALQTCCFPDQWKHSIVSPIFKKKGSKASISNYRPISLLILPAKSSKKFFSSIYINI